MISSLLRNYGKALPIAQQKRDEGKFQLMEIKPEAAPVIQGGLWQTAADANELK